MQGIGQKIVIMGCTGIMSIETDILYPTHFGFFVDATLKYILFFLLAEVSCVLHLTGSGGMTPKHVQGNPLFLKEQF